MSAPKRSRDTPARSGPNIPRSQRHTHCPSVSLSHAGFAAVELLRAQHTRGNRSLAIDRALQYCLREGVDLGDDAFPEKK